MVQNIPWCDSVFYCARCGDKNKVYVEFFFFLKDNKEVLYHFKRKTEEIGSSVLFVTILRVDTAAWS